jgi:hypothetical protein
MSFFSNSNKVGWAKLLTVISSYPDNDSLVKHINSEVDKRFRDMNINDPKNRQQIKEMLAKSGNSDLGLMDPKVVEMAGKYRKSDMASHAYTKDVNKIDEIKGIANKIEQEIESFNKSLKPFRVSNKYP